MSSLQRSSPAPNQQEEFEKRGTVDIDVATRRVIRLAYLSTDVTGDGTRQLQSGEELTLSGFGQPVVVTKPAPIANR